MLVALLPLFLLSASTPTRTALMPLVASEGIAEKTADAMTDALAAELRRAPGVQLLTRQELSSVMSVERQKTLLGCQSDSCMSEIAGALDVDQLVTGSIAKLGESWMFHLQRVDARKAQTLSHADRRIKGGTIDDALDHFPGMVQELYGAAAAVSRAAMPAPQPASAAPVFPPSWADEPVDAETAKAQLTVIADAQGHYVAFVPFAIMDSPFFYGDDHRLYAQRVFGGGSEAGKSFDLVFWEPRAHGAANASFSFANGSYSMRCGKHETAFTPLAPDKAKAILNRVKLLKPRWQRHAYALARDDEGTYYYVDQAREPEDSDDLRLYSGVRGSVIGQPTQVLAKDRDGDVLAAPSGKLRISRAKHEAEWITGTDHRKLTYLEVEANAVLIYTALGAYKGEILGTPCDGAL